MLVGLAVWVVVFTAAAGYGRLLVPRSASSESAESEFTRVYAGLLIVSTMLLATALFMNLTPWVGIIAALPGIAMYWREGNFGKRLRYYFAILALVALFISTREINFYDTALYHQQAVKWLAEHGLVRGVALLHFRFGFVSSWFALAAPLNHGATAGRVGIVGGISFALAIVSGLEVVFALLHRRAPTTRAILGLMLSVVAVVWHIDTSLSPDVMVWLLPLVIVTILSDPNATEADRLGRATVISGMACLVKLPAAPVFVYCFALLSWRFIHHKQDRGKLSAFGGAALGAIALLLGANLIASGCPAFPSPLGCTSLTWSVGADAARSVQDQIEQFPRTSRHGQIFPLTAAAALASVLLGAIMRNHYSRHIIGIAWTGISVTLTVAPVARYGLGYFLLPVAAILGTALERLIAARLGTDEFDGWVRASILATAIAAIATLIVSTVVWDRPSLLYPRRIAAGNGDLIHIVNRVLDARKSLAFHADQRGELTIWTPESSDQCWDAPLPCTPKLTRGDVGLRIKGNLDAGFLTP